MKIWIWAFVLLVVGFLVILFMANPAAPERTIESPADLANEWVKGNTDALVILVEYSDFQCPACAYFHDLINKIVAEFGSKTAFVYRHYPLPQHKVAPYAAYAAEAAGTQGKFFEMHDLIFENQNIWSNQPIADAKVTFLQYATEIGIADLEKFKNDFESEQVMDAVEDDLDYATKIGLNSTPTFFLNGQQIANPSNYEQFRELIRAEIDKTSTEN